MTCRKWLLFAVLYFSAAPVAAEPLRAGVACVDLTPPLAMKPALGGYSARLSRPATGVHDRVWAKAIYFTDGSAKYALVTADALGFPSTLKPALMAKLKDLKVEVDDVLLLPSHTHTSLGIMDLNPTNVFGVPQIGVFNGLVLEHTLERLAEVIQRARQEPVSVLVGTATLTLPGWSRNRRGASVTDPVLTVTRIDRLDGKPLAVVVNWSAHPTFLGAKDMIFSGDWPGYLQRTLEGLIGESVTVLYYNGAQGDQSPTPRIAEAATGFEQAEAYGRDLALQAWKTWRGLKPQSEAGLAFHLHEFELPKRVRHPEFMKNDNAISSVLGAGLDGMLERIMPEKTHSHCFRLGDLVIVGIPGELTAELGMEVKLKVATATGARVVVIGGLADEWIGYILSEKEYNRGGYEATVSYYGRQLGPIVVENAVKAATAIEVKK